jgi:hypothetical protein
MDISYRLLERCGELRGGEGGWRIVIRMPEALGQKYPQAIFV